MTKWVKWGMAAGMAATLTLLVRRPQLHFDNGVRGIGEFRLAHPLGLRVPPNHVLLQIVNRLTPRAPQRNGLRPFQQ